MEAVATPLCRYVDHSSRIEPKLRTQAVCLDLEFLNEVFGWDQGGEVDVIDVDGCSINIRGALVRSPAANLVIAPSEVGSSRVDLQACKLEYSIVSPK